MAKEFAFEQLARYGCAIHADECALASRAAIVNRARDKFLAGSRFALDQHRCRRRRNDGDLLDDIAKRRTAANDAVWGVLRTSSRR